MAPVRVVPVFDELEDRHLHLGVGFESVAVSTAAGLCAAVPVHFYAAVDSRHDEHEISLAYDVPDIGPDGRIPLCQHP